MVVGYRDCAVFNLSRTECEIYTLLKRGMSEEDVRKQIGMTVFQFERYITSIKRKKYLTHEFNKKAKK